MTDFETYIKETHTNTQTNMMNTSGTTRGAKFVELGMCELNSSENSNNCF